MRTRARNPFSTVTTAGLLLPVDLLTRIVDGDPNLPGLSPKDYHLRSSERLNEAASRAWNECLAAWKTFRKKFAALPASDAGTTLTRDEWLLPLFQELGYGRLQPKKAVEIAGREYPISHGWESHVPVHLLSARYPIDRRTPGTAGAATRAPYSLLQELLNRSGQYRWGFVSNGLKLYLLHDNAALARAANVEFDLEAMMDGELYADFMLLFLLCHQSRVEIQPTPIAKVTLDRKTGKAKKAKVTSQKKLAVDDGSENADDGEAGDAEEERIRLGPENCWLERWANQADQQGTRARDKLRDGVEAAIKALGAGFLTTKGNQRLRERMRTGVLSTQDYYRQLLRVVYRLLMLLVAEEKKTENGANLLHPPSTAPEVRERYARFYSVSRIRALAYERRGTAHSDLYESLKVLFLKLREGYAPLGIPGMGSFLFSDDSTPDLDELLLSNQDLLDAFRHLCYTDDTSGRGGSIRRPVDFGNLGSDELGSVYESLLELHPMIETDDGPFTLGTASGNERKTTGSYYTPTSLITGLLDSALDPVVHEAIDVSDRAEAERKLLNLKVCDPACGSGHFLIAAAGRMAMHLARLRTGDDQPNALDVQHAKRDIIGRCIYGVDINPMAVELCKVSLWMEALEPGKPLSFLDHHIQCGNSLLGTTPGLLQTGIPDNAFTPIEGDDRKFCSILKADNKKQRKDTEQGQTGFAFDQLIEAAHLGQLMMSINDAPDETLDQLEKKRARAKQFFASPVWQDAHFWADYWCAAFVWKKNGSDLAKHCPTERDFRRIERGGRKTLLSHVSAEANRLSEQYQFFHWHLAFPDVFRVPGKANEPENVQTGWNGGFDVVLGNPPWERIKLQEQEWFAQRRPDIATARNAAERRKMIEELQTTDAALYAAFLDDRRKAEGESHFIRSSSSFDETTDVSSGLFPLCGRGDVNTYSLFAELNRDLISAIGRVGCVIPSGIATDDTTKLFFQSLARKRSLISLLSFFEIRLIFIDTDSRNPFCLLTLTGQDRPADSAVFVFNARSVDELRDDHRQFALSRNDFQLLNPNTFTCPVFSSKRDAELTKNIYRRVPVLIQEGSAQVNSWGIRFMAMLHMANDSGLFRSVDQLEEEGWTRGGNTYHKAKAEYVPLYEAKMLHQFDHRWATYEGRESRDFDSDQKRNAAQLAIPRYWVPKVAICEKLLDRTEHQWLLGWRDVSRRGDKRTMIASAVPAVGIGDKFLLMIPKIAPDLAACLLGCLNSFVFDYVTRQKLGGTALKYFVVKQLPTPAPSAFEQNAGWTDKQRRSGWLASRVLELTYTAWDLEPFARDIGYDGPPFVWADERRFWLRCELDAASCLLYGLNDSDVSFILDSFSHVAAGDIKVHGFYRTKDEILNVYRALNEAIRTGIPYQTPLIPPPGPPTDAEGQFIPFAKWNGSLNTSHIHPPREATPEKPQKIVVDPAFPKTDLEKVLCACLLDLVTSKPGLAEDQYVDLMILAMQPANCRMLLTGDDRNQFDQSLKTVLPSLIADSDGKPPWRLLIGTLRANQSIQGAGGKFFMGPTAEMVRGKLLEVDSQFLAMVLKAGERLRELQEAATPDPALARVVRDVQNHRAAAKVGATSA